MRACLCVCVCLCLWLRVCVCVYMFVHDLADVHGVSVSARLCVCMSV